MASLPPQNVSSSAVSSVQTRENLSLFLTACLVFFVLSSKHILIYNEETLVVLAFMGFLTVCFQMGGESIESALNQRSSTIFHELNASLDLKENFLHECIQEQKKQLSVQKFLQATQNTSLSELSHLSTQRFLGLQGFFSHSILQKLKSLVLTQNSQQEKLQKTFCLSFRGSVIEEFLHSKKTLKAKLIQDSLVDLKNS